LCTEGLVKPDIVFFGESLPARFFQYMATDFSKADLLIVLGTSLTVQPFASLIGTPHELVHAENDSLQVSLSMHREVHKPQQQISCVSC
jgi:NAD-dependent SIR2 family protein deacetylase